MRLNPATFRALALGILSALLLSGAAGAAEVRVMISGGLTPAYKVLVPEFERVSGHKVLTAHGPSMGTTVNAIPVRLERGEPADVLIMVGYALGDLVKQGKVISDTRVDTRQIANRDCGQIGSPEAGHQFGRRNQARIAGGENDRLFRQRQRRLCSTEMFAKLGWDAMKDKARKFPATPVR